MRKFEGLALREWESDAETGDALPVRLERMRVLDDFARFLAGAFTAKRNSQRIRKCIKSFRL